MTVYVYDDSVAAGLAAQLVDVQNAAIALDGTFNIAISGGSLGKVLKQALVDDAATAAQIHWDKWQVYFSDERLVPLDHADSNYGLFIELVVKFLGDKKPKIVTIDETLLTGKDGLIEGSDAQKDLQIAQDYEAKLPEKLHLVLLGCGPDGHTCSLFPGHELLKERSKKVALIRDSPKPPPRRITITFPVLEAADKLTFVAEGAGKAPILKEIFTDPASQLPSKLVTDIGNATWFVNAPAVEGVDVVRAKY